MTGIDHSLSDTVPQTDISYSPRARAANMWEDLISKEEPCPTSSQGFVHCSQFRASGVQNPLSTVGSR
jgi:hypothetical protein